MAKTSKEAHFSVIQIFGRLQVVLLKHALQVARRKNESEVTVEDVAVALKEVVRNSESLLNHLWPECEASHAERQAG